MQILPSYGAITKHLARFSTEDLSHRSFSSTAAAFKRSKKLWPPEGSWEYAITDYKLRKQAGLNFLDSGLPAGAEQADEEGDPASEAEPSPEGDTNSTSPQEPELATQTGPQESISEESTSVINQRPPRQQTENEDVAREKRQFAVAMRRAQARAENHVAERFPAVKVINHAGPDRAGWRNLWRDSKTGHALWEMDLTGGRAPLNERNACLSRKSKDYIVDLHRKGASVPEIAELFRIRQQRVMALVALDTVEKRARAAGLPQHEHFRVMMEGDYLVDGDGDFVHGGIDPCNEAVGSGERHVKILPRAPHYEVKKDEQGKPVQRDWTAEEEQIAAEEEKHMVAEFADKIYHNLGLLGGGLQKNITKDRPSRPKGGYSLLVKDLSAPANVKREGLQSAGAPKRDCYVAQPDGRRRELNEDEKYMQYAKRVRPRRKL